MAFQYDLIWRNASAHLLPLAQDRNIGVVLDAPLQQGKLATVHKEWLQEPPVWMDYDLKRRFSELYDIQRETGLSLPELAIRFVLADDQFGGVIPGAASLSELEENVRVAATGPLDSDTHMRLQALGKMFEENRP